MVNNTRVSALRLFGNKTTGGSVEALLLRRTEGLTFDALLKPGRRLPVGAEIHFSDGLSAVVLEELREGQKRLEFRAVHDFEARLAVQGLAPLPPYIHKPLSDRERYQTVYGSASGSAAAPTAGLHFTDHILEELCGKGVQIANVTLHVGLDTFRPVQVDNPADHPIHGETCEVSEETADRVANCEGRIIAVGTTSVRTLETFAIGQRRLEAGRRVSKLYIRPGFAFQIIDGMFTNFHMPRTTMMMMISALAGREVIMNSYAQAVREQYRFLSFGDSMLIL